MLNLLESALRVSTPLMFAALGGVLSERAGVINIGLEGMMLVGAFAGWAMALASGNSWLGVLAAAAAGALLASLHAVLVLRLRVDAIISGVGLNLLAVGLTTYVLGAMTGGTYLGDQSARLAPWVPSLAGVPVLGTILGARSPLVPMALLAAGIAWFVMYRTRPGLQLRAVGEAPRAALAAGIRVERARYAWLAIGGALAGLGGAYLALEATGRFTQNATAGRGYLALAAVIFGRWNPVGAATAVAVFALAEAFQMTMQGNRILGLTVPSELMSALPFILGLVALTGVLGKTSPPAGLGQLD